MKKLLFFTLFFASQIALAMQPEQQCATLNQHKNTTREKIAYCCDVVGKVGNWCDTNPCPADCIGRPNCCTTLAFAAVGGYFGGEEVACYTSTITSTVFLVAKCIGFYRAQSIKERWE